MSGWMILWTTVLVVAVLGFVGMLWLIGFGAIGELRQTLEELRADTREAAEHPEVLDEAT